MPQTAASNEKPFTGTEDETLNCSDCKQPFTFAVGEQEFYLQKGFTNRPRRCKECREANKAKKGNSQSRR